VVSSGAAVVTQASELDLNSAPRLIWKAQHSFCCPYYVKGHVLRAAFFAEAE